MEVFVRERISMQESLRNGSEATRYITQEGFLPSRETRLGHDGTGGVDTMRSRFEADAGKARN